jgi:putative Mg2+ transporter-C (MgtC) family protein
VTLAAGVTDGQTWTQVGELAVAFALSALIGLERELRGKPAGLRTLTIVGFASALFIQISKYGFFDVMSAQVKLDPSRVAAQVVSGLGFIGGGLVFIRRDAVRGLTTAAVVWLVAAVGMAAGAGLPLLAGVVTAGHFVIVYAFTPLSQRLKQRPRGTDPLLLTYRDRQGVLRRVLAECTERGFVVRDLHTYDDDADGRDEEDGLRRVTVRLAVDGPGDAAELAAALADLDGVLALRTGGDDEAD